MKRSSGYGPPPGVFPLKPRHTSPDNSSESDANSSESDEPLAPSEEHSVTREPLQSSCEFKLTSRLPVKNPTQPLPKTRTPKTGASRCSKNGPRASGTLKRIARPRTRPLHPQTSPSHPPTRTTKTRARTSTTRARERGMRARTGKSTRCGRATAGLTCISRSPLTSRCPFVCVFDRAAQRRKASSPTRGCYFLAGLWLSSSASATVLHRRVLGTWFQRIARGTVSVGERSVQAENSGE